MLDDQTVILLAPYGSRGDVQPVATIGRELSRRGHRVVLCAPPDLASIAASADLPFVPVGPPQAHLFDGSQSNVATFRAALGVTRQQVDALLPLAAEASVIVGSALQFAAPSIAARQGIPYLYVMLSPLYLRTPGLSPMAAPKHALGRGLHRVLLAIDDARHLRHATDLRALRREWHQPPISSLESYLTRSGKILLVSDPVLAPAPFEDAQVVHTGHVYLDEFAGLPEEVETFIDSGPPPIFIGFGSMRHLDGERLAHALWEGVRLAGMRAIIHQSLARFNPTTQRAPNVFVTGDLPHRALFPRVAACVHHGGYGTTIEAARAGVPQVIIPHLGDQFHHAERTARLGIGAEPIPLAQLTAENFARALAFALHPTTSIVARRFGEALCAREGTARAADEVQAALFGAATVAAGRPTP